MRDRVLPAVLTLTALVAGACSGSAPIDESARAADLPALGGIQRNVDDGSRRLDVDIDPDLLVATPAPEPRIGQFTIPCGPAEGSTALSFAPGVTATTITIGTGNDRGGFFAAGWGRGMPDAIRALADRCNALGGIDGRLIVVVEHDAAVTEVLARMAEACADDFALVGSGYVLDTAAAPTLTECGLPAFPAWTTGASALSDRTVVAVPGRPRLMALDALMVAAFAAGASSDRILALVPATDGGRETADRISRAVALSPLESTVSVAEYPLDRAPDWDGIVAGARPDGVGVVWVEGTCESVLVPLIESAARAGWRPAVLAGPEAYDPACAAAHGEILEGVLVQLTQHPVTDRDSRPVIEEHVLLFGAAGVVATADTLKAASAFWLWASAVHECRASLSRRCVTDAAAAIDGWTAGGLHPPTDPGSSTDSGCVVVLHVSDGAFDRLAPIDEGMICDSDVTVDLG